MTNEDPILKFLSEPDNLALAFEISEVLDRLVVEMHSAFWPAVAKALADKLSSSTVFSAYWEVDPPSNPSQYFERWMSCDLVPTVVDVKGKRPYAIIKLQQSTQSSNFWLQYGVAFTMQPKNNFHEGRELEILKESLSKIGLTPNPPWWPGVSRLPYYARLKEFTTKMATDPEQFMAELVGNQWEILNMCHNEIAAYNQFVTENRNYEAK